MGSENKDQFWFPAKTYGAGWGWLGTWQGWVVVLILIYILLMIIGSFLLARLTPDFLKSYIKWTHSLNTALKRTGKGRHFFNQYSLA